MIERRAWLLLVGGGLLAACTGPTQGPPEGERPEPADPNPNPLGGAAGECTVTLSEEGQVLGYLYLRSTPQEALVAGLRGALPRGAAALTARIKADYAGDDVVVLRGWILARTEARLLALGALQSGCALL